MKKGKVPFPLELKIREIVENQGYEFVGMQFINEHERTTLCIYIDSLGGILVKDCENVSKAVNRFFEEDSKLEPEDRYYLEVSSPGLERPLFRIDDYVRFSGDLVRIKTRVPIEGRRKFTGTIDSVRDNIITIKTDSSESFEIEIEKITKANLVWNGDMKK